MAFYKPNVGSLGAEWWLLVSAISTRLMAREEPVFITENGTIRYALLNIDDYLAVTREPRTLSDSLAMDESDYFNYDFLGPEGGFRKVATAPFSKNKKHKKGMAQKYPLCAQRPIHPRGAQKRRARLR